MKKIGIVTFHFVDNFGAVLQCYALQKVINRFNGVYAEIIDFRPMGYRYEKVWTNEKEKNLFYEKRKKFENFLIKFCNMSPNRVSVIDGKGYDYCCVGSDQIWNPMFTYEEYFLPNVNHRTHKIAYAASVGCSISEIELNKNIFLKYLPTFKKISVREIEHKDYISTISGKECSYVLDPTLLLDKEDYLTIIQNKKENIERSYVFFYWLFHDQELMRGIELVNSIARKFNLQIIHSVFGKKEFMFCEEEKCMYYSGIDEFLWYIKNAAFVVTNSYHGTIFSLKFEVPFYSFVVDSMRSRFNTLLKYMDIEDRIVTKMIEEKDLNMDIDYKGIKESIFTYRVKSIEYLKNAIDIL